MSHANDAAHARQPALGVAHHVRRPCWHSLSHTPIRKCSNGVPPRTAWSVMYCSSSPTVTPAEMRTRGAPLALCLHTACSAWASPQWHGVRAPQGLSAAGELKCVAWCKLLSRALHAALLQPVALRMAQVGVHAYQAALPPHALPGLRNQELNPPARAHPAFSMRCPLGSFSIPVKMTSVACSVTACTSSSLHKHSSALSDRFSDHIASQSFMLARLLTAARCMCPHRTSCHVTTNAQHCKVL
jgi:hypothetical protein